MSPHPTSKKFLIGALVLVVLAAIGWFVFRSPERGTDGSRWIGGEAAQEGKRPHGHGEDTPLNRSLDPDAAPVAVTTEEGCDLFNTGIMDADCDGIPNWLEERNETNQNDPNKPYKQGGWDHDDDGVFHGMDGHYACDAYDDKLLNCKENNPSTREAVTATQDTDGGGVPDVMEIIKDMDPLDPCDDRETCDPGTSSGTGVTGATTPTGSTTGTTPTPITPTNPLLAQLQGMLGTIHTSLAHSVDVINQYSEVINIDDPHFGTFDLLHSGVNQLDIKYQEAVAQLQDLIESESTAEMLGSDIDRAEVLAQQVQTLSAQVLTLNSQIEQYVMIVPIDGWRTRYDVKVAIDLVRSLWQGGRMVMWGLVNTEGAPFVMELRYFMVEPTLANAYRHYCISDPSLGFDQINPEDNQTPGDVVSDILDFILGMINGSSYGRAPILLVEGIDPSGTVHYSDTVQSAPGQWVPFTTVVEGLDPNALYGFAIVDPTFTIPIPVGQLLNLPVELNVNLNLFGNSLISSFIFAGPSCFDILNRIPPKIALDTANSTLTGGQDYTGGGGVIPAAAGVFDSTTVPADSTALFVPPPRAPGAPEPIRDGEARMVMTLNLNTAYQAYNLTPNALNQPVDIPLLLRWRTGNMQHRLMLSPVRTVLGQTTAFILPPITNIHASDTFEIVDPSSNHILFGPFPFGRINESNSTLESPLVERWFFITDFVGIPKKISRLYDSKAYCEQIGRAQMGTPVTCYSTQLANVHFTPAPPKGFPDAEYTQAQTAFPEDTIIANTKFTLRGKIDTLGSPYRLALEVRDAGPVLDNATEPPTALPNQLGAPLLIPYPTLVQSNPGVPVLVGFDTATKADLFDHHWYYVRIFDPTIDQVAGFAPTASLVSDGFFTIYEGWMKTGYDELGGEVLELSDSLLGADMHIDIPETPSDGNDLDNPESGTSLLNPLDTAHVSTFKELVHQIFVVIARLLPFVVGALLFYSAILLLTAGNNTDRRTKGILVLQYTLLGLGFMIIVLIIGLGFSDIPSCLSGGACS